MRKGNISLVAIMTLAVLMLAASVPATVIDSDLTAAEREAVAEMFESLGQLVAAEGEVSDEQERRLVAAFLQSLGSVSKAAAEDEGDAAIGIEIERLFNAIGTLVELGEQSAESPEMRQASASLMRTIGSLVKADPDNDLTRQEEELITGLFDAVGDLIEHEDDPDAEKRFASRLFLTLAAFIAEDGEE